MFDKKSVMKHYDDISGLYSKSHNQAYYKWRRDVVLNFSPLSGKTLLDVGCGSGTFVSDPAVTKNAKLVVGLDISREILKKAREKTDVAKLVQGDSSALPFSDFSFDVVTSLDALEHTPDPLGTIEELCRVAREKIVLATPNALISDPVFAVLEAFKLKMPEGPHSMVKKSEIIDCFKKSGWTVKTKTVALGLCILYLAEPSPSS